MPKDRKLPNFNRYPMLWLAGFFAVGILLANFVSLETIWFVVSVAVTASLAGLFRKHGLSTIFIGIAFLAAGAGSFQFEVQRNNAPDRLKVLYDNGTIRSGDPVEIEGILLGRPEPSIDG